MSIYLCESLRERSGQTTTVPNLFCLVGFQQLDDNMYLYLFSDVSNSSCPADKQLSCLDGSCIPIAERINGVVKCPDGSDERKSDQVGPTRST